MVKDYDFAVELIFSAILRSSLEFDAKTLKSIYFSNLSSGTILIDIFNLIFRISTSLFFRYNALHCASKISR